jgi:F-type H+-transporting ATPase subunit delta
MDAKTLPATYATALLDLAAEKGELEAVREEVETLEQLLRKEPVLQLFLESPRIVTAEKRQVIEKTLRGRFSDALVNFLLVVVGKRREVMFLDMLRSFQILHDKRQGIVRALVTTATVFDDEEGERLRAWLENVLGKRVVLERKVDDTLLGGFVIHYDGMVVDATLKTALHEIRAGMRSHKFGSELVHEN